MAWEMPDLSLLMDILLEFNICISKSLEKELAVNRIDDSSKRFVFIRKILTLGIPGRIKGKDLKDEPEFNSKNHSMEIDSLRGIAILLVFLYHSFGVLTTNSIQIPKNVSGLFFSFIFTGATGVTLFLL